jgi:hypothetical protein
LCITYENPCNENKEKIFFESFNLLSKRIPEGSWKKSERPDYILYTPTRCYGLEITSLTNPTLAGIRDAQDKCLKMAENLAENRGMPYLTVEVGFRNNSRLIDSEENAQTLVAFVESKLNYLDDTGDYYTEESGLPDIEKVRIQHGTVYGQKWLDNHRYSRDHLNIVTVDPIRLLQETINKKEGKLHDYLAKCDECWLLIGVDEWTAPEAIYFTQRGTDYVYKCGFSRLFFLRNIQRLLVELRTKTS